MSLEVLPIGKYLLCFDKVLKNECTVAPGLSKNCKENTSPKLEHLYSADVWQKKTPPYLKKLNLDHISGLKNVQLVVSFTFFSLSHPTPYWSGPSKMEEVFKTLQRLATTAADQQRPSVLQFQTKNVRCQRTTHCHPSRNKLTKRQEQIRETTFRSLLHIQQEMIRQDIQYTTFLRAVHKTIRKTRSCHYMKRW